MNQKNNPAPQIGDLFLVGTTNDRLKGAPKGAPSAELRIGLRLAVYSDRDAHCFTCTHDAGGAINGVVLIGEDQRWQDFVSLEGSPFRQTNAGQPVVLAVIFDPMDLPILDFWFQIAEEICRDSRVTQLNAMAAKYPVPALELVTFVVKTAVEFTDKNPGRKLFDLKKHSAAIDRLNALRTAILTAHPHLATSA